MPSDVLFRSAAAVLFSLHIHVLHLPFSYEHSNIPVFTVGSYFYNKDLDYILNDDEKVDDGDDDNGGDDGDYFFLGEQYCPALLESEHGSVEGECQNAKPKDSCIFKCGKGYSLHGQNVLLCSSNLIWDGEPPICVRQGENCPRLLKPENGDLYGSCEYAKKGGLCTFRCNDGYMLDGKQDLFCRSTLNWSVKVPRCVKKASQHCKPLITPLYATKEGSCDNAVSGEKCTFTCDEGYELVGKKTLTCTHNFFWDGVAPRCKRKELCRKLQKPENANWTGPCENATKGESCTFTCSNGYTLQGYEQLFCMATLEWNAQEPQCVKNEENCPKLTKPENGDWKGSCEDATPGQKCIFECNDGYQLKGEEELTCSETLTWDKHEPRCVKEDSELCPKLQKPENGDWKGSCEYAKKGELCTFICNDGYMLEGKQELFCRESLIWNGQEPRCVKNDSELCPKLQKPENGDWNGSCEYAKKGELCTFICNDGYILQGRQELFCRETLKWNGQEPRCVKNESEHCPKLQKPENGDWEGSCEYATKGELCTFRCNDGYMLQGKQELFCRKTLKWNGQEPRCVKNESEHCPKLQKPENGEWEGSCEYAKKGELCTFRCNDGYMLQGKSELFCRATLKWNGQEPRCVKNDGPKPNGFDCSDIKQRYPNSRDGIYKIHHQQLNKSINVFCDMTTDDGGWTVFQRRTQGNKTENFFRDWMDYKTGFGDLTEEFWLGNDYIHALTEHEPQVLRVDMEDFENSKTFAKYLHFAISDESSDYKLTAREYTGDAGDSLYWHNGCRFTTKDHGVNSMQTAAEKHKGAWWYINLIRAHYSNLNGLNLGGKHETFGDGINWYTWHAYHYSLKKTEMKMKPRD